MLRRGSMFLSTWCVINFVLAFIILSYVIVLKKDSPILQVASFSEAEIARPQCQDHCRSQLLYDPVQLLLAGCLRADLAAHPQEPNRRSNIGFLDVSVRDRLCGSDGIFRFLIHWEWTLAGERCSEHALRCGHWFVRISHTQAKKPTARSNSGIRKGYSHESDCLHRIRFTGCSSAPRGGKTCSEE